MTDRLVVGIRDVALSDRLQTEADLTLEKAKMLIRQKEATKEHHRELQENRKSPPWARSVRTNDSRRGHLLVAEDRSSVKVQVCPSHRGSKGMSVVGATERNTHLESGAQLWERHVITATRRAILVPGATIRRDLNPQ